MTHKGSWNSFLLGFAVGDSQLVETTLENYAHDMRVMNVAPSRRPAKTRYWVFETRLYTCVGAAGAGDIFYLIRITRTA